MWGLPGLSARRVCALAVVAVLGGCAPRHPTEAELDQLFSEGLPFDAYLAQHEDRREAWVEAYGDVVVDTALLTRARAIPGDWRLLAVVAPWCPDSQATVAALERLSEEVDNLELRLFNAEGGHPVKDAHPTPDGRSSTPTLLLLDSSGAERGCLVEMPGTMQAWWLEEGLQSADDHVKAERKRTWYRADGGRAAWSDLLLIMEAAARGEERCVPHQEAAQ
jgi:thiol-disulfide isomerase/thioredoxin